MNDAKHFTTRRAFVAASGFGGISLYGLWAAYGAAPGPLALLGVDRPNGVAHAHEVAASAPTGGHGGHGGGGAAGPTAEEFSRMTAEFIERFRMPDGSVYPRRLPASSADHHDGHDGHDMTPAAPVSRNVAMPADPHAGHGAVPGAATVVPDAHAHGQTPLDHAPGAPADGSPIEVLMTAGKWYYLPNVLRLDVGQAYRFKMMALDVSHGASIQFGKGGRMMRLQPGRLGESELTFQRPGRYLMHCTVYCGQAHDLMQATIEVV
ncbi:hypothetical protein [Rhodoferax sp.]|uniref:hypothetical protein n=1 Tax=Rhodoferax sp. TaxID=50421 RepID=UPI002778123B|nr:hypothetical protein [Rhodoferax sp.]